MVDPASIGAVVGYQAESGRLVLSSWSGDARRLWVKFDCDPTRVPLMDLPKHVTSAEDAPKGAERPEGFLEAWCFMRRARP